MSNNTITLANLNMLYVRYVDRVEQEIHLPLGLLHVARSLEDAGLEVDFRDLQLWQDDDPFDHGSIARFLEGSAEVVFVSCMANLLPFSLLALERFSRQRPDAVLVLGGVGPAVVEAEVLELCPWIHAVGVGEGERSTPLLARALCDGLDLHDVPGVAWRDGDRVRVNAPAPRLTDLDAMPMPAYHLVDLPRYRGINMLSSRGCPFPCSFCSVAPIWGREPHLRSAASIAREMQHLHDQGGVELFLFQDEYFVSSAARVAELCAAFAELDFAPRWKAFGRIDLTDVATMEAMADAGCVEIRYGVESGCDAVLQRTRKGFSATRSLEVMSMATGIFPGVDAFYMWGFPFETADQFNETLLHMLSARAMGVRILPSLLSLLPLTRIYEEMEDRSVLEFCPELFPEYMLTGHETCVNGRVVIDPRHEEIYRLIQANPNIFPGFFHVDVEGNVLPKYRLLQKFGFYSAEGRTELLGSEVECCGAHQPEPAEPGSAGGC